MIPIYCYHHIVPSSIYKEILPINKSLYIIIDKFEKQLQILQNNNIKTLSTNEFIDIIKNKKPCTNSVLITFDDGNEDQYTYAYPLLKKYNMKAVFFLITSRINNNLYLKDNQLIEMKDLIDYHSHTHELHNMSKIRTTTNNDKYKDLVYSISILKKYNRPSIKYSLFCFPYGITGKYFTNIFKTNIFEACFAVENKIYNFNKHSKFNIPRKVISNNSI